MNAPAIVAPEATPRPEVRAKVREMLAATPSFHQLPADTQMQVARDTALIADALVGQAEAGTQSVTAQPMAEKSQWESNKQAVDDIGKEEFSAGSLMAGAQAAGEFMRQVNFVEFVSGLIDGVFNSIITSNIQQMEAYSKMVSDVSKSLNQFRDDNTTSDDGKDQLCEQFPDLFDIGADAFSGGGAAQLRIKDGADLDAGLQRVRDTLGSHADKEIDSIDVTDPEVQETLIKAARGQIATSRQQLLATMVMMGLSRIVVTNGKIQAKILYDFNASSQRTLSRTAMARDYARDASGNLAVTTDGEGESERGGTSKGDYSGSYQSGKSSYSGNYDSDYYTKGKYKYSQKPVMTAQAVASDQSTDQISAKASLAGLVDVNFKSDYLPLEKMATPEMIAAIQMRSKPVDHNKPQYTPGPAPAPAAPAPAATPAPAPAHA
ncbi:hypothetical protein HNP52_001231 [Sphingomonas kyeonggiensis]|uniref:Uncharacterized protein n=1 Tax=Sphingomonas kyeonggiensis TaxID=1268553 RepID=A0A7W7K0L3_9SPHN|nr:hypothetical protein [Sphingomonas kyeonggiensis]MBB4838180.1 hypothetical protein [Sphingomonas kyeonggiensis]